MSENNIAIRTTVFSTCSRLIDKLGILEIKFERIANPQSRANIVRELDALAKVRDRAVLVTPALTELGL